MLLRAFAVSCVLVLAGSLPGLAQQPTQKPAAVTAEADGDAATVVGPKRAAGTVARPKNGVQHPDLDKAWAEYEAAVAKATESVKAAINKQFDAATAKGDFDSAKKWQAALEKFEKAGELPTEKEIKASVSAAVVEYKKAREKLTRVYEVVVKGMTMDQKIPDAQAARDELAVLVAELQEKGGFADGRPAPPAPPEVNAVPEIKLKQANDIIRQLQQQMKPDAWEKLWDTLPGRVVKVDSQSQQNGAIEIDAATTLLVVPHPTDRWKDEDVPIGDLFDFTGYCKENDKRKDGIALEAITTFPAVQGVREESVKKVLVRDLVKDQFRIPIEPPATLYLGPRLPNNGVGVKHKGVIRVKVMSVPQKK